MTDVEYHASDTEAFVMDLPGNRTGDETLRNEGQVSFTVESLANRCTGVAGRPVARDKAGRGDHEASRA